MAFPNPNSGTPFRMCLSPLTIEFRKAKNDRKFTDLYLKNVLSNTISDPTDRLGLFNASSAGLERADAVIEMGFSGDLHPPVGGMNIVVDGSGTAWLQGVCVAKQHRGYGHGVRLVRAAQSFLRTSLGLLTCALVVRCSDAGIPYEIPYRLYQSCGFQNAGTPISFVVSGMPCDQHIGRVGEEFKAQVMLWKS